MIIYMALFSCRPSFSRPVLNSFVKHLVAANTDPDLASSSKLQDICWLSHYVRIWIVHVWLARSREGGSAYHHSIIVRTKSSFTLIGSLLLISSSPHNGKHLYFLWVLKVSVSIMDKHNGIINTKYLSIFFIDNWLFCFVYRLLVTDSKRYAYLFLMLSTIGNFSLFPLVFTSAGLSYFTETFQHIACLLLTLSTDCIWA